MEVPGQPGCQNTEIPSRKEEVPAYGESHCDAFAARLGGGVSQRRLPSLGPLPILPPLME
jgi:hypothetical protein